ncbi:MAG: NAD-dependent epimerase/dehydratase family protein [Bdellovibrionia bacterium]
MNLCGSDLKQAKFGGSVINHPSLRSAKPIQKVFVTGGNGFLGSHTVARLVACGYEVHCLLRKQSDWSRIAHLPIQIHWGDVLDLPSLVQGVADCDAIIHLACISAWNQILKCKDQLEKVGIQGTQHVLEAARIRGNLRVIHVSSAAAINGSAQPIVFNETAPYELDHSTLLYSQVKHEGEKLALRYLAEFQTPVVIVNPAEVYGENDEQLVTASNLLEVLRGKICFIPQGGMALAHVEDISRGIVLALEKGRVGERYILGGENLTLKEFATLVRKIAGKNNWVIHVPRGLLRWICRKVSQMGFTPPTPLEVLDYAVLYWFMDSSKATQELGYQFRSAEETLRSTVRWLLSRQQLLQTGGQR